MNKQNNPSKGQLFIISGPSGVGKTVLCGAIIDKFAPNAVYSISATSRPPRGGEKYGQEYFFYTVKEFEEAVKQNEFAEWAFVHGNYYGTPKRFVDEQRLAGKNVLLNIDVQGALKIVNTYPEAVMIFVMPPNLAELENRIRKRNTESEEAVKQRLKNARKELDYKNRYKYVIINDNLNTAIKELTDIYLANAFISSSAPV